MNLEEEMERYKVRIDGFEFDGLIDKKYAIEIAEEYALEKCKEQRDICANEYIAVSMPTHTNKVLGIAEKIANSPLATEVKE